MITFAVITCIFVLGACALSLGAGIITFGIHALGHLAKAILSVFGVLLMPLAILMAVAFGVGYALPILVPAALIVLVVSLACPKKA